MTTEFLSHEDAAERNKNSIIHFIKKNGPVSRTDIWENMNISRASVTGIIRGLCEGGVLTETGEGESTGGRRPTYLQFDGSQKKFFAFDWISKILCLMDMDGKVLSQMIIDFIAKPSPEEFKKIILTGMKNINETFSCDKKHIMGFALSMPGINDADNKKVIYSVELGWENVSIKEMFSEYFGENIFIEKTANMMALGALRDENQEEHFQLFILGEEGIGVSAVVGGKCQHGTAFMYGELGHIKTPSKVLCSCGQKGCLEAVVNDIFIKNEKKITSELLDYLAIGIATAINITDSAGILLVGSYIDKMSENEKANLTQMIKDKVTSFKLRNINIRFSDRIKEMTFDGIAIDVFNKYYHID